MAKFECMRTDQTGLALVAGLVGMCTVLVCNEPCDLRYRTDGKTARLAPTLGYWAKP